MAEKLGTGLQTQLAQSVTGCVLQDSPLHTEYNMTSGVLLIFKKVLYEAKFSETIVSTIDPVYGPWLAH